MPLRGLSGSLRRVAYRYPDHLAAHWLLLLLADRVDSLEARASRSLKVVVPAAVMGLLGMRALARR